MRGTCAVSNAVAALGGAGGVAKLAPAMSLRIPTPHGRL